MAPDHQKHADFLLALGQCFADHLCPPVDFELASPQEFCEAVGGYFDQDLTPRRLSELSPVQYIELADEIAEYFECDTPEFDQLFAAVGAVLKRWPAGSLGEYMG